MFKTIKIKNMIKIKIISFLGLPIYKCYIHIFFDEIDSFKELKYILCCSD